VKALIKGYAAVFEQPRYIAREDVVKVFDVHAFDEFLAQSQQVPVVWLDHNSDTPIAITSELFADAFGLGFSFSIDQTDPAVSGIVSGTTNRCSILFRGTSDDERCGNAVHTRIKCATVEHICVLGDPAFPTAFCWRADENALLDRAPPRIRELDTQWQAGYTANQAAKAKAKAKAPEYELTGMMRMAAYHPFAATDESRARIAALLEGNAPWLMKR
jgi:phage head maturation protease